MKRALTCTALLLLCRAAAAEETPPKETPAPAAPAPAAPAPATPAPETATTETRATETPSTEAPVKRTPAKGTVGGSAPAGFGENTDPHYESAQWLAFELKFGPYSPDIDSSPGLRGTPFSDLFNPQGTKGRPPGRLLTTLELDFQFFHRFGSLGFGHSIGYYRRTSHSFQYPTGSDGMPMKDANGNVISCVVGSCIRSGDETALNILPLEFMLVYRFDVLALRYKVPIVPYVKLGLAYYIWWIENGEGFGSTSTFTDNKGKSQDGYGGTFGWVANPGVALLLDVLDPSAARTVDSELGINHSYLFFEMHYADISSFGAGGKLVLSDLTWNAGLAFEF